MLRATTACTFSTSQLPKVVQTPGVLYILTWKCASRHNGVQFFISHLASWLRTRRFSEPTFRPLEKHSVSRLSYPFAHLHLLSSDLVSSDSSHLCFSTVHIVGSFTSKLPSIMLYHVISCYINQLCQVVSKMNILAIEHWSPVGATSGSLVQVARTPCRSRSNLAWLGGFLSRGGSPVVTIVFVKMVICGLDWMTWMIWMRTGVPKNDFGNLHPLVI